jgi:hypothetical protein
MVKPVRCMWAEFLKPLFSKEKEEKETAKSSCSSQAGRSARQVPHLSWAYCRVLWLAMPCLLEAVRRDVFTFFFKIFGGSCAALLQSHWLAEAIKFVGRITLDLRIYQGNITIAGFLLSVFPDQLEAYCLIITLRIGNRSVAVAHLLHTKSSSRVAASFRGHSHGVGHSNHDAAGRSHRRLKHLP